jgi:hypothetical protein
MPGGLPSFSNPKLRLNFRRMSAEHYASLAISSETMSWSEMARIVDMTPDKFWQPGDFRGKTKAKHKNHGCIFESKLPKGVALENHVKQLLKSLSTHSSIFQLSNQADVTFSCAVYSASSPPLFFEKSLVAQIAALGASLDLDIYIFPTKKGRGDESTKSGSTRHRRVNKTND